MSAGSRREPDVPVFGSRDLRRVGLVAADEPPEQLACRRGNADRQQEMPHHRHPVAAQDEALNVARSSAVAVLDPQAHRLGRRCPQQTVEEPPPSFASDAVP